MTMSSTRRELRRCLCKSKFLIHSSFIPSSFYETHAHFSLPSYLAPWTFTTTLLPLLKKTAAQPNSDVRIVNVSFHISLPKRTGDRLKTSHQVSSGAYKFAGDDISFNSIDDFNRMFADDLKGADASWMIKMKRFGEIERERLLRLDFPHTYS